MFVKEEVEGWRYQSGGGHRVARQVVYVGQTGFWLQTEDASA